MGALKEWDYRREVAKILVRYPVYKKSLEVLFPPTVYRLEERTEGGKKEFRSSTEKYGMIRAERSKLVERIEKALEILTEKEREIIEETYLKPSVKPASEKWEELGWSKTHYYRVRNNALEKLAIALGIIDKGKIRE